MVSDMFVEIKRITRDLPPAHYIFNIESFSLLVDTGVEKYESHEFEVGSYKWSLSLYPNGNLKGNGSGFISLYLQIEGTENFTPTWEVNVNFRFFVHDQIRDKYLAIEEGDGLIKRFYQMKKKWGIAQLLSLDHFNDATNGYLVDDCCTFGVEIFVIKHTGKLECLSMIKNPTNGTITFYLQNYSKAYSDYYASDVQTIGDSKWRLVVYPRGKGGIWKGYYLSIYLELIEAYLLPPKRKVYANYKLRVRDKYNSSNNKEVTHANWFSASNYQWGSNHFMLLGVLQDKTKSYILNDTLTVEAEINIVSKVKRF
ncbi:hypothetical protein PTKIN_Ptkin07bG0036200 [Pterospermum kingtungense]